MKGKRFLGVVLALLLVCSLVFGQITVAFAETGPVVAVTEREGGSVSKEAGNIVVTFDNRTGNVAAHAVATGGNEATITVEENISAGGNPVSPRDGGPALANGVDAEARGNGSSAEVTVGDGIEVTSNIATGSVVNAFEGGEAGIKVQSGGISANAESGNGVGTRARADGGGTASFEVQSGGITVEANNGIGTGLDIRNYDGSRSEIAISGGIDVSASGKAQIEPNKLADAGAVGITVHVGVDPGSPFENTPPGDYAPGNENTVVVNGNVTVEAAGKATGVAAEVKNSSSSDIDIEGSVQVTSKKTPAAGVFTGTNEDSNSSMSVGGDVVVKGNGGKIIYDNSNITVAHNRVVDYYFDLNEESWGLYSVSNENGGNAAIDVAGNVAVDGGTGDATGVHVAGFEGGSAEASVGGNVTVSGDDAFGAQVFAGGYKPGATKTMLEVGGNVTVKAESVAGGVIVGAEKDGGRNPDSLIESGKYEVILSYFDKNGYRVDPYFEINTGSENGTVIKPADDIMITRSVMSASNVAGNTFYHSAVDNASVEVTIEGDVSAESEGWLAEGVSVFAKDSDVSVSVAGDVTSKSGVNGAAAGIYMLTENSTTEITVGGNVTAEGGSPKDAVTTAEAVFVVMRGNDTVKIDIGGNVAATTSGDTNAHGIFITGTGSGPQKVEVSVAGDVTADDYGVIINGLSSGQSDIDILIEGTLSAAKNAVVVNQLSASELSLTVWKVDVEEGKNIVSSGDKSPADAIESNIMYIIKLEQPEQGSVSLVGTTESHGFDTAKEGETVTLKAEAGYKIVGAYNGTDIKVTLLQDNNGDFYIVVPKGGGVYLTVEMGEEEMGEEENENEPAYRFAVYDSEPVNVENGAVVFYVPPMDVQNEVIVSIVTGTAEDGSTISRELDEVLKTGETVIASPEFEQAVASEDTIVHGTVDFQGIFADAQEEVIEVPVKVSGTIKGVAYTVVFSDGTSIQVTCEENGILMIPFPKDAANIGFAVQRDPKAEFAAKYHRAIELYRKFGRYADLGFLPYEIQLQVIDFVDSSAA